jgi:hypothetical protein
MCNVRCSLLSLSLSLSLFPVARSKVAASSGIFPSQKDNDERVGTSDVGNDVAVCVSPISGSGGKSFEFDDPELLAASVAYYAALGAGRVFLYHSMRKETYSGGDSGGSGGGGGGAGGATAAESHTSSSGKSVISSTTYKKKVEQ